MPVYEFHCEQCDERFEIVSKLSDRAENAVCPRCGGREVVPVYGVFRVGISRGTLNPGHFERKKGRPPEYKPPPGG